MCHKGGHSTSSSSPMMHSRGASMSLASMATTPRRRFQLIALLGMVLRFTVKIYLMLASNISLVSVGLVPHQRHS